MDPTALQGLDEGTAKQPIVHFEGGFAMAACGADLCDGDGYDIAAHSRSLAATSCAACLAIVSSGRVAAELAELTGINIRVCEAYLATCEGWDDELPVEPTLPDLEAFNRSLLEGILDE